MRVIRPLLLFLLVSTFSVTALAATNKEAEKLKASLQARFPDVTVEMPRPSVIPGFYEVVMGGQVMYASKSGRYLLNGDLIDLQHDRNLSEMRRMAMRRQILENIPLSQMVVVGSAEAPRHLTVFSNVDCMYCRKLNEELQNLVSRGQLQVRYVLLPEGKPDSPSYSRTVAVWCAPNRIVAMNKAMSGAKIGNYQCQTPMADLLKTARKLNVRGLPTLFLDNGAMIAGMPPLDQLESLMQTTSASK